MKPRAAVIRFRRFVSQPHIAPFFVAANWRLGSGLVLFSFVVLHFLNHALGIFGVEVMDAAQVWRRAFWRSWTGTILLYGAAFIHVTLAIAKILARTTWRMPLAEALQIALGLSIPYLVNAHIAATRGLASAFGVNDTYTHELRLLWPYYSWSHSALLIIVWLHAIIGLRAWLRTKSFYRPARDWLAAIALLIPALALAGWVSAGREVAKRKFDTPAITRPQFDFVRGWERYVDQWFLIVLGLMVLALAIFAWMRLRRDSIQINYLSVRSVRAVPGSTLLEISRAYGVAHASVCGGKARCSTCRVRVIRGGEYLEGMSEREKTVLARIGAPRGVRLACRIVPIRDLTVELLVVPADAQTAIVGQVDHQRWGEERNITVLFADLRGFTTLAEKHLAFDVVFLINRYATLMSEAVEKHGGQIDKFLGDGVLALFGVKSHAREAARAALAAAEDMFRALDILNGEFATLLDSSLKMGIGVHSGPAIVGRIGAAGSASGLTALGDTVNTASRLQDATKQLGCALIVSKDTIDQAGFTLPPETERSLPLRGREQMLQVHALDAGALLSINRTENAATAA